MKMSRTIFLVFVMLYCLMPTHAARFCQDTGFNGVRSQFFHQAHNQFLAGHQYRNLTGAQSKLQCCAACLTDTNCFSVQYSDRGELCQLNGASASRCPLALTTVTGTSYYGLEKPSFIELLQQQSTTRDPSPTDCLHQTFTSATSECQDSNQHLCFPWELHQAVHITSYNDIISRDSEYWYAMPESQVQYTSSDQQLVYRDLGPIILAGSDDVSSTGSSESVGIADFCSINSLGRQLCTLEELKQAFLKGYRQPFSDQWVAFSDSSRYAQLFADGCGNHTGPECYGGVVANIPSTDTSDKVYCCPNAVIAPGLCCPKVLVPFFTEGVYLIGDRDGMAGDCSKTLDAHLCTLAELKEAYLSGYRQPSSGWRFFAVPERDAQLISDDGCGKYATDPNQCYEGVVANTPRPGSGPSLAFCCPSLD